MNFNDNRMMQVNPQGAVTLFATISEKGLGYLCFKGERFYARLSFPMGIACHPWVPRLYVNEDVNESALPRRSIIRVVTLETSK